MLNDESIMKYGVWKGTRLIDIPASYFLYVYENNKCSDEVREYIEDNLEVIKQQTRLKNG